MEPWIVVNGYLAGEVHDRFPVNTWGGNADQVSRCVATLLKNKDRNGFSRIEIVVDCNHPNWRVGLNPRDLSTDETISEVKS